MSEFVIQIVKAKDVFTPLSLSTDGLHSLLIENLSDKKLQIEMVLVSLLMH